LALFGVTLILALVALAYGSAVADNSISILDVAVQTLSQQSSAVAAATSAATPNTASTSTTRHSFDVDASLNNLHNQRRHLQDEVLNNFTASYVKCYSLIDEVAFGADAMTQDQSRIFATLDGRRT
jgi:hypothetical protein